MSLPPESIQVGRCYLTEVREGRTGKRVCKVIAVSPGGHLTYKHRALDRNRLRSWHKAWTSLDTFASLVSREVPCDWTLEADRAIR
jgi:hypothetical protein